MDLASINLYHLDLYCQCCHKVNLLNCTLTISGPQFNCHLSINTGEEYAITLMAGSFPVVITRRQDSRVETADPYTKDMLCV